MPNESDFARLGAAVRRRRAGLRLRQSDLEARGGPSAGTVKNIEQAARAKYADRTFSQIERALGWKPGTARGILDDTAGADPEQWVADAPASEAATTGECACRVGSPAWIERELATERRINAIAQVFQSEAQRLLALIEATRHPVATDTKG